MPEGYKRCPKCDKVKPVSEFHKNRSKSDGLQIYCRVCILERGKEYYEENKDKFYAKNKKYYGCVKKPSCPAVGCNGAEFVIFTCPVCGKEFRRLKSKVDYQYEKYGQTHFYCSRECQRETLRKSHKTEYEKNIKRIRKEQRL